MTPRPRAVRSAGRIAFLVTLAGFAGLSWAAPSKLAYRPDAPELHPNLARGLDIGLEFEEDRETSVNLFNGNLVLQVPLGQRYPIDTTLSYQLSLYYNSRIWDFDTVSGAPVAEPARLSNAGLGFDLSLGRLLAPSDPANGTGNWLYVSRDGSPHLFYADLHWDTPDVGDTGDQVQYTRDGTYFRLRQISSSETRVEFANGTYQRFEPDGAGGWRLASIHSAAGNTLSIAYAIDGSEWTLTDSHGRSQHVRFAPDPSGHFPRLVHEVDISAFAGQRAVYTFQYATISVPRACADSRGGSISVPQLVSVTDPVGYVRDFGYHAANSDCRNAGRLHSARLATGGYQTWDYGAYSFPPLSCDTPTEPYLTDVSGVVARHHQQPDGTVTATWTHQPVVAWNDGQGAGGLGSPPTPSCGMLARHTRVTTPLGDRTDYHFAVGTDAGGTPDVALYALPVAPHVAESSGPGMLSKQIWDCDPTGTSCNLMRSIYQAWDQDADCTSATGTCFDTNRRKVTETTYFHDDTPLEGALRFRRLSHGNYDGLGQFRSLIKTSNFGQDDYLSAYRATNPQAGIYGGGSETGGSFTVPSRTEPWFLHGYAYEQRADGNGETLRTDACFDAVGQLIRTRRRVQASAPSSADIINESSWSGGQNVATRKYGGDRQIVAQGADLCTLSLPTAEYENARQYSFGSLSRAYAVDAAGNRFGPFTLHHQIDVNTGLVTIDRDPAGLATTFDYDLLGRLTWTRPAAHGGAWIEAIYREPQGGSFLGSGPRRTTHSRANGGGAVLQTQVAYTDNFGRATFASQSMPGGVDSVERTEYDAVGNIIRSSTPYTPGPGVTIHFTHYQDHDPFGRARRVLPPEGSAHEVTFAFAGERQITKTEQGAWNYSTATGQCYENDVVTTELYDGQGRLWRTVLDRPLPQPGVLLETETEYDLAGKSRLHTTWRTVGAETHEGSLEWVFDGRGLLTATIQREGTTELARNELSSFDAGGRPHLSATTDLEHGTDVVTTLSEYDTAGRLVRIVDADDPTRIWKEYEYATANLPSGATPDRSLGKVARRIRHTYFDLSHFKVEETWSYRGVGGRPSTKTVAIETVFSPSIELRVDKAYTMDFAYDDLGEVSTIDYPRCTTCATGEPTTSRQVSIFRDHGLITAINGQRDGLTENWVDEVDWGVNTIPERIRHANGIEELYEPDPFRRPMYTSIELPTLSFDSGDYVRDGRGNLCGVDDRKAVQGPVPTLSVADAVNASAGCKRHVIDPFGAWSGELEVTSIPCTFSRPFVLILDGADRVVAALDFNVQEKVFQDGEWTWIPDPENFTYTWSLYGLGRQLQEVEDHIGGAWRSTLDLVGGIFQLAGKAEAKPGEVRFYHQHPLNVRNTNANGQSVDPR